MNSHKIWRREFEDARRDISAFVVEQAHATAHKLGFGWTPQADAPNVFPALEEAYEKSVKERAPLPVSSLYCDTVIFTKPEINHAMRFWHDTKHINTGLTFDLDDELDLGLRHLQDAVKVGIKPGTMVYDMLRIDLIGQNYCLGIARRFPLDQGTFVKECLTYGLDEGVLREARREVT